MSAAVLTLKVPQITKNIKLTNFFQQLAVGWKSCNMQLCRMLFGINSDPKCQVLPSKFGASHLAQDGFSTSLGCNLVMVYAGLAPVL